MPVIRDEAGRAIGFACSRGRRQKVCTYCGAEADRLCDARLTSGPRAGQTCDVPMCHRHSFRPSTNVDYCRDHVPAPKKETTDAPA